MGPFSGGADKSKGETLGYDQSVANQGKADALTGQVNANDAQFQGPVQQTPFYKGLLQQGTTSTNQAYDNANRNLKMAMEGSGISGASGVAEGNGAAVGAQRAGALGQVGTNATEGATGLQMQANQQKLQEAGMYSGAGLGYFSGGSQSESDRLKSQGDWKQAAMQAAMMAAMAG